MWRRRRRRRRRRRIKRGNHLNKNMPPHTTIIPNMCFLFIFSFINNIVSNNNINIFKLIIDTGLLGLPECLNELNIHGSTIIYIINNLNTIKNISL